MKTQYTQGELIRNPKNDKVSDRIHGAYRYLVDAEKNFSKALKEFTPIPPIKKGDKVYAKFKNNLPIQLYKPYIVGIVKYDPYNGKSFGGWHISLWPATTSFEKINNRYAKWATNETQIKKATE